MHCNSVAHVEELQQQQQPPFPPFSPLLFASSYSFLFFLPLSLFSASGSNIRLFSWSSLSLSLSLPVPSLYHPSTSTVIWKIQATNRQTSVAPSCWKDLENGTVHTSRRTGGERKIDGPKVSGSMPTVSNGNIIALARISVTYSCFLVASCWILAALLCSPLQSSAALCSPLQRTADCLH